jgi:hypothetical protein
MWVPALAAMSTRLAMARTLRGLGWRLAALRHLLIAYPLPLAIAAASLAIALAAGAGTLALEF